MPHIHPSSVQITWTASAAGRMINLKMAEEELVSYLPLSHVAAQVQDMWICMRFAGITSFAEPDALKVKLQLLRCAHYLLLEILA